MRASHAGGICDKCGEEHLTFRGGTACVGHIKHGPRQGKRCLKAPIKGGFVCLDHGGRPKHVRVAAANRVAIAEVTQAIQGEIATPISDPSAALEQLSSEAFRYFEAYKARVEELDKPRPDGTPGDGVRYKSSQGFEQIRGEAQLMGQYMDRAQRFHESQVKLPLEARRVRIAEMEQRRVVHAFQYALTKANLTEEQKELLKQAFVQALRGEDNGHDEEPKLG